MSFLLTGCAFNNDNPSSGGNNPPVEEVKETFIPKVGEVKMLFDDGTIGETSCKIVDVDYIKGVCYNSDGGYNNYVGSACDNRYIEIIGSKNITIASPNVNVNRIIVVEYNENKDMINFTSQTTSNKSLTLELNENTRYIRISFWFNIYETKMAQLFYEYKITQN